MKGLLAIPLVLFGAQDMTNTVTYGGYDETYVSFETLEGEDARFHIVSLNRQDDHVKVKYFAARNDEQTVEERFNEWGAGKNIILYTSGAYMSELGASNAGIVGLTIDEGTTVNDKFTEEKMDGLVVVQSNGSIVIRDLSNEYIDFNVAESEVRFKMSNAMHVERFEDFAEANDWTVFQTHLLVKDGEMKVAENSSDHRAERRFLVQAVNRAGEEFHYIIHMPEAATLFNGTLAVKEYLEADGFSVVALINLDTGAQDVFRYFDQDGEINEDLQGRLDVTSTSNLMVYYYED